MIVCRTPDDLLRAPELFAATDRVVVEAFLDIRSNLCLAFLVLPDGSTEYAGTAGQASSPDGGFRGTWLVRDLEVPEAAVSAALVPLGTFDPGCAGYDGPARLRSLVWGESQADVRETTERLAAEGALTR